MDKPSVLYHGTCNDIKINDCLKPFSNYSRNSMQCINAVFATRNKTKSVYFGLRSCLAGRNSRCKLDNNRIFLSSLKEKLKNIFMYILWSQRISSWIKRMNIFHIKTLVFYLWKDMTCNGL